MPLKAPPKATPRLPVTAARPAPPLQKPDPDDKIPMGSGDGLPDAPTDQSVNMQSLRWLAIAPPGWGKSELFAGFPGALMLACEEGHKFITCHKMIIDEWEGKGSETDDDGNIHLSFMEALRRITASSRFAFIIIDTLDALIKKCIDYHITKANQQHLSDLGEYGKGYDLGQNDPIRRALAEIFSSGRGMGLITHQNVETKQFAKAGPKAKKETTLPPGITKIVYPQMDIIIHGEFGGIREGNRHKDRILKSEGTEDMLAKNRGGILPPSWIVPLDLEERSKQIQGFFNPDEEIRKANVEAAYKQYGDFYEID